MGKILIFEKKIELFRFILILFFVGVFFWLFYKDFVPSGRLIVKNDFWDKSNLISDLHPDVRLRKINQDNDGEYFQTVFIDPVYFEVGSPRIFTKARVLIKYKNESQDHFQLGIKIGSRGWNFDIKPLEFQKIDNLSWDRIEAGELLLLQKEKNYDSLLDFLSNPPKNKRIALYNFSLKAANAQDYLLAPLNSKTDLEHVSYIFAKYKSPVQKDKFKIAQAEFTVDESYLDDGKLAFIISAPKMDILKNEIDIYEIKVILEKTPFGLLAEIKDYFRFTAKDMFKK